VIRSLPLPRLAMPAVFSFVEEESEHVSRFLGIPMTIWQIANLVLFLAVLIYFVAKPMAAAFRKRQVEIEERRRQADRQRADAERLTMEIRERAARLDVEIAEIRRQGIAEGESARTALSARAKEEAEQVLRRAAEEIERRLAAAKSELAAAAADHTVSAAAETVSREITDEDRRRLLNESVSRLKASR